MVEVTKSLSVDVSIVIYSIIRCVIHVIPPVLFCIDCGSPIIAPRFDCLSHLFAVNKKKSAVKGPFLCTIPC